MVTAFPRVHIICGACGCKKMLQYRIERDGAYDDDTDTYSDTVWLSCKNCSTVTELDELMEAEQRKEQA